MENRPGPKEPDVEEEVEILGEKDMDDTITLGHERSAGFSGQSLS